MQKAAANESLLSRMVNAQWAFVADLFEQLEGLLKRQYRTVAARREDSSGMIRTTYKFRKPNEFYDVSVEVRVTLGQNIGILVLFKDRKLAGTWTPDTSPDRIAKATADMVAEIIG
jgi:hypothetical protein